MGSRLKRRSRKFLYGAILCSALAFATAVPFLSASICKHQELRRFKTAAEILDSNGCRKTEITDLKCGRFAEIEVAYINVGEEKCRNKTDFQIASSIYKEVGQNDKAANMKKEAEKRDYDSSSAAMPRLFGIKPDRFQLGLFGGCFSFLGVITLALGLQYRKNNNSKNDQTPSDTNLPNQD